jgi:hypothetical protein
MRCMLLVKADQTTEAGVLPSQELVAAMGQFNDEMVNAGVRLAAEGLHPNSKGARLKFSGEERTVIDGPFPETTELVAGCWIIQVKSTAEAIEWASRVPFTDDEVIEVRQVLEASDFPPEILPPEAAAREQAWRDEHQRKATKP